MRRMHKLMRRLPLHEIETLNLVVAKGSFSEAARALGLSQSSVSRQVAALEKRIDSKLLDRTTRSFRLTQMGALFHERSKRALDDLAELENEVMERSSEPAGHLRLTAPPAYGRKILVPRLAHFCRAFPKIQLEMIFLERYVSLVEEGYDLAVRIGELGDTSVVGTVFDESAYAVYASPGYLKSRGRPKGPRELLRHACLVLGTNHPHTTLELTRNKERVKIVLPATLRSNDIAALLAAAAEGIGVAALPRFLADEAVSEGRLIELFPDWQLPSLPVYAVHPDRRFVSLAARRLFDFISQCRNT